MADGTFEQELARLEDIVRRLESQDLDLDESLRLFEEGVERLRAVRDRLAHAEAKVKELLDHRD
jgi:exodeoxyribonuclease VII small subunit